MPITVLPDLTGAIVARVRSFADTVALVNTTAGWEDSRSASPRVSAQLQDKWNLPCHAIWIDGPKPGPSVGDDYSGIRWSRYDFNFFGPGTVGDTGTQRREAMRLWRTLHPAICPRQEGVAQFVAASTRVRNVQLDAGPTSTVDPDGGWGLVIASYAFQWDEVPAS